MVLGEGVKEKFGVVSFPKCGRTWIRLFLEYYSMYTNSYPRIVFRHNDQFDFEKRVLMIRHPCDVMVSLHLHYTFRKKSNISLSEWIRHDDVGIPLLNKLYGVWSERTDNQLIVRYEDMFDTAIWMCILDFFDIDMDKEAFDRAIEKTKFDNVRNNLDEIKGFHSAWRYLAAEHGKYYVTNPKNPEAHKFRRGIAGGYVDYMSEEDVRYVMDNFTFGHNLEEYAQQYRAQVKA